MGSWSPKEPARQRAYRRRYLRIKERFDRLDDTIAYMLTRIERLEARLDGTMIKQMGRKRHRLYMRGH